MTAGRPAPWHTVPTSWKEEEVVVVVVRRVAADRQQLLRKERHALHRENGAHRKWRAPPLGTGTARARREPPPTDPCFPVSGPRDGDTQSLPGLK